MSDFDPTLPARAKHGDEQAFIRIVEFYYPRCLRFARNMLGSEQDAEEAVQDTFVRVHDSFSRFREDARFDPWLFQILANRCRTLMARNRRHRSLIEYGDVPATATIRHGNKVLTLADILIGDHVEVKGTRTTTGPGPSWWMPGAPWPMPRRAWRPTRWPGPARRC